MKNIYKFFLSFWVAVVLFGCRTQNDSIFSDTVEFCLLLPKWNNFEIEYPELFGWQIEVTAFSGSGDLIEKSFFLSSDTEAVSVKLFENVPAAILAYPITICDGQKISFFKPAGCVYPQNNSKLLWSQGFAADLLASLEKTIENKGDASQFLSLFNWKRLIEKVLANEEDSQNQIILENASKDGVETGDSGENVDSEDFSAYYNPWSLDKDAIVLSIAERNFSIYKLNFPDYFTVGDDYKSFCSIAQTTDFLSDYIPQNQFVQNFHFMTIIKETEKNRFLLNNNLVYFSVNSDGQAELEFCPLPLYREN